MKNKERIEKLEINTSKIEKEVNILNEAVRNLCNDHYNDLGESKDKKNGNTDKPKYVDKNGDELIEGFYYKINYGENKLKVKYSNPFFTNGGQLLDPGKYTSIERVTEDEWKPKKGVRYKAYNDDPNDWCIVPYVEMVLSSAGDVYKCGTTGSISYFKNISHIDNKTIEQLKGGMK